MPKSDERDPSKPLQNSRAERFACELAKGASQSEAYRLAGYKHDTGAASRLSANVSVMARVSWLKSQAAESAVLTIREKREFLARVVKLKGTKINEDADGDLINGVSYDQHGNRVLKIPDKLRAIALDNDLAEDGAEAAANRAIAVTVRRAWEKADEGD